MFDDETTNYLLFAMSNLNESFARYIQEDEYKSESNFIILDELLTLEILSNYLDQIKTSHYPTIDFSKTRDGKTILEYLDQYMSNVWHINGYFPPNYRGINYKKQLADVRNELIYCMNLQEISNVKL